VQTSFWSLIPTALRFQGIPGCFPSRDTTPENFHVGKAFFCIASRLTGGTGFPISGAVKKDLLASVKLRELCLEIRQGDGPLKM
jgi:hypothetical protein